MRVTYLGSTRASPERAGAEPLLLPLKSHEIGAGVCGDERLIAVQRELDDVRKRSAREAPIQLRRATEHAQGLLDLAAAVVEAAHDHVHVRGRGHGYQCGLASLH